MMWPSPDPTATRKETTIETDLFSLNRLAASIYEEGITDLDEMTAAMLDRIPEEQYGAAIRQMVKGYLRHYVISRRPSGTIGEPTTPADRQRRLAEQAQVERQTRQTARNGSLEPAERTGQWQSPRVRDVNSAAAQMRERWLSARWRGANAYKELRHFTIEDCDFQIGVTKNMAEALAARMDGMVRVREALVEYGAHEVKDLPLDVQNELFATTQN